MPICDLFVEHFTNSPAAPGVSLFILILVIKRCCSLQSWSFNETQWLNKAFLSGLLSGSFPDFNNPRSGKWPFCDETNQHRFGWKGPQRLKTEESWSFFLVLGILGFFQKAVMSEKKKKLVAYHEAGHAILGALDFGNAWKVEVCEWMRWVNYPLVNDHIAIAGISPFLIGNASTQSGSIFQPAMLDYPSVTTVT